MALAAIQPRVFTVDDYRQLPPARWQYQLVEGEIVMTPAPRPSHQDAAGGIYRALWNWAKSTGRGHVWISPIDVHFSATSVLQPDVVFLAQEKLSAVEDDGIHAVPDLVVEVLSPHSERLDLVRKRAIYAQAGIPEHWVVDVDQRVVEVLQLGGAEYRSLGLFRAGETLRSPLLGEHAISLASVFLSA